MDGGDSFKKRKVAVNILNTQFQLADKGWSFKMRVVESVNSSLPLKMNMLHNVKQSFGL